MLRKQLYPSSLTTCFWQRTHFVLIEKRITCAAFEQEPLASRPNRRPCISFSMISLFIKSFRKLAGLLGRERKKTSDNQTDRPGSERKGGEISDERALHILRYRSKQPTTPAKSLSLQRSACRSHAARQMTQCGEKDHSRGRRGITDSWTAGWC